MPYCQVLKRRLSYDFFSALSFATLTAYESKDSSGVTPELVASCLARQAKKSLTSEIDTNRLNNFISVCWNKNIKDVQIFSSLEDVPVHRTVSSLVKAAMKSSEDFGAAHALYFLIKNDDSVNSIASKCKIKQDDLLTIINRESYANRSKQEVKKTEPQAKKEKEDLVSKHCVDLTLKAKTGQLPRVFCRESELDQIMVALMKKNKANPLLIGEPGVGKTALAEALAKKIVSGQVPERLRGYRLLSLSMGSLVQGTTLRGMFEERLEEILKAIVRDGKVILFIDEIHTMVGAGAGGGEEGSLDASNIMKPYLARGEIKCIGATTFDDFHKKIRKDKALARRFQRVFVSEPNDDQTVEILKCVSKAYEEFHGCKIDDEIFEYTVKMCKRYIKDRFFPDKALDCFDHCCAKASLLGDNVSKNIVDMVISEFSDVPLSFIQTRDADKVNEIKEKLQDVFVGNKEAINNLCGRIKYDLCIKRQKKGATSSIAIYGPKGVGKRSIVRKIAEELLGEKSLIVLNGLDFSESHSINSLVGSPPGYSGHNDEVFILREIRRRPSSVILIQNTSRFHPTVADKIRHILDTGKMVDVNGMETDFSNCLIIATHDTVEEKNSLGFGRQDQKNSPSAFDKIKQSDRILGAFGCGIQFVKINNEEKSEIISFELDGIRDELQNSGIMLGYTESAFGHFLEMDGSPSEIRCKIRTIVENEISSIICSDFNSYVVDFDEKVIVRGSDEFKSVAVQI